MTDDQLAIQAHDRELYTAFHMAVQAQNLPVVEMLVERCKKNPKLFEQKDKYGQTALQWASEHPNSKIEKILIETFSLLTKDVKEFTEEQNYQQGLKYYHAIGVEENLKEASKYFKLAADKGHAEAMDYLADIYENKRDGNSYSDNVVLKLYQESAAKNYCRAQWKLGYAHEKGQLGLKPNPESAAKYYIKAWKEKKYEGYNGYFERFFEKHPELKVLIQQKQKTATDNVDVKKIADELTPDQNYEQGRKYYHAIGVVEDFKEAIKYFKLAADTGHAMSKYYLADIYENGRDGNSYSDNVVLKLYQESAAKNYCRAQWKLGHAYENGELGLKEDLDKAAKYYKMAWDEHKYEGWKGYYDKFLKKNSESLKEMSAKTDDKGNTQTQTINLASEGQSGARPKK
jgi:TPR repeat protein